MKFIKLSPLTPVIFAAAFLLGYGKNFSILYCLTFLHEMAHFLAAQLLGAQPRFIHLLPYGCMLSVSSPKSGLSGAFIFAAGPLLNIALAMLGIFKDENIILALFNLIPVAPLDGGMIIASLFPRAASFVAVISNIALFISALLKKESLFLPLILLIFIISDKHRRIEKRVIDVSRKILGKSIEKS